MAILCSGPDDGGEMHEELVAGGVLPLALAAIQGSNEDIQAKGAELVAELAKVGMLCHSLVVSITVLMYSDYETIVCIKPHASSFMHTC